VPHLDGDTELQFSEVLHLKLPQRLC
jgi:hypothetical protein